MLVKVATSKSGYIIWLPVGIQIRINLGFPPKNFRQQENGNGWT